MSKTARIWAQINRLWGEKLRFNHRTLKIELEERELQNHDLVAMQKKLELNPSFNEDIAKDRFIDTLLAYSLKDQYDPVRDYLKRVYEEHRPPTIHLLAKPAERYLGVSEELDNVFFRKILVAAARRAFQPGTKVDTMWILMGKQGLGKSTFFRVLAGPENFVEGLRLSNIDKDEKLKLRAGWIVEAAECEDMGVKRNHGVLKDFLSTPVDVLRRPYGRGTERFPRISIIVGSTNKRVILSDPTGNRRFWITIVTDRINWELLAEERDRLWAEAVSLAVQSEEKVIHWLTPIEEEANNRRNENHLLGNPYADRILNYVHQQVLQNRIDSEFLGWTIDELIRDALVEDITRRVQMEIGNTLADLGFVKYRRQVRGSRHVFWVPPPDLVIDSEMLPSVDHILVFAEHFGQKNKQPQFQHSTATSSNEINAYSSPSSVKKKKCKENTEEKKRSLELFETSFEDNSNLDK